MGNSREAVFAGLEPAGINFTVRDMGNGVIRLLSVAALEEIPPMEFFSAFGPIPLVFPLPGKVSDILEFAQDELGLIAGLIEFSGGVMRPLTCDITEFVVW